MSSPELSVVVPVYNEAAVIEELVRRCKDAAQQVTEAWELILVDDHSDDATPELLAELADGERVQHLRLPRNVGQFRATRAGLRASRGEHVIVLDGDLQDPPEEIPRFLDKIKEGYDVVYGIRIKRKASFFKKIFYNLFYEIYSKLSEIDVPKKAGDFCLMKKKVVKTLNSLGEKNLFMRGLRSWVGFKQTGIEYERDRRYGGKTKFSFFGASALALDGIVSFSLIPLRFILVTGIIMSALSMIVFLFLFSVKILSIINFISDDALWIMPKGLTLTNLILTLFLGLIMFILGIIGEYVGRIYFEVKNRPNYVINEIIL